MGRRSAAKGRRTLRIKNCPGGLKPEGVGSWQGKKLEEGEKGDYYRLQQISFRRWLKPERQQKTSKGAGLKKGQGRMPLTLHFLSQAPPLILADSHL